MRSRRPRVRTGAHQRCWAPVVGALLVGALVLTTAPAGAGTEPGEPGRGDDAGSAVAAPTPSEPPVAEPGPSPVPTAPEAPPLGGPLPEPEDDPPVVHDLLVVPVRTAWDDQLDPAWLAEQMDGVNARLGEMSHGEVSYDVTVSPLEAEWIWFPNEDHGCLVHALGDLAFQLEGLEPAVSEYDRVVFWWHREQACTGTPQNYAGGGVKDAPTGPAGATWVWVDGHDEPTWSRLLAQAEGVTASGAHRCAGGWGQVAPPDPCTALGERNPFDLMNSRSPYQDDRAHPPAATKVHLGWLPGSSVAVPHDGQVSTHTLAPLESDTGVRAIEVPIGAATFWIEYRTPAGFDAHLGSWPMVGSGVQVYHESAGGLRLLDFGVGTAGTTLADFRDATLPFGMPWDHASGLSVRVVGAGPDGATVQVYRPVEPLPPSDVVIDGNPATGHVRVSWTPPATPHPVDSYEVRFTRVTDGWSEVPEVVVVPGSMTTADVTQTFPMRPGVLEAEVRARFDTQWSGPATAERAVSLEVPVTAGWTSGSSSVSVELGTPVLDPLLDPPDAYVVVDPGITCATGPVSAPGATQVPLAGPGYRTMAAMARWTATSAEAGTQAMVGSAAVTVDGGSSPLDERVGSYDPDADVLDLSWSPGGSGVIGYLATWCSVFGPFHQKVVPAPAADGVTVAGAHDGLVVAAVEALGSGAAFATGGAQPLLVDATQTALVGVAPAAVPEGDFSHAVEAELQLDGPAEADGWRFVTVTGPACTSDTGAWTAAQEGSSTVRLRIVVNGDTADGPDTTCGVDLGWPFQGSVGSVAILDDD